jgi:hypothetical protein
MAARKCVVSSPELRMYVSSKFNKLPKELGWCDVVVKCSARDIKGGRMQLGAWSSFPQNGEGPTLSQWGARELPPTVGFSLISRLFLPATT